MTFASTRSIELTYPQNDNRQVLFKGICLGATDPFHSENWTSGRQTSPSFTTSFLTTGNTNHYHIVTQIVGPDSTTQHVFCLHFPSTADQDGLRALEIGVELDQNGHPRPAFCRTREQKEVKIREYKNCELFNANTPFNVQIVSQKSFQLELGSR